MAEFNKIYREQFNLLLNIIPELNNFEDFALKGGTAINLFLLPLPRLSVDLDLVYLPIKDRTESINTITENLNKLSDILKKSKYNTQFGKKEIPKLVVSKDKINVKIEPNLTLRGIVLPTKILESQSAVKKLYGRSVKCKLLNPIEIYAGKICAALDRQHPRDFFDLGFLKKVIDEKDFPVLRSVFCVYMAMGDRPMNELIKPNRNPRFRSLFESQFRGMVEETDTTEQKLLDIFEEFLNSQALKFTEGEKEFLMGIQSGEMKASGLNLSKESVAAVEQLPGIQWKLRNVETLKKNKDKFSKIMRSLESSLKD